MENFKAKLAGCLKSLTVWFNGVLLAALPVAEYLKTAMPDIQQYTSAETYKMIGMVVIIANLALRFRTNKALEDK